MQTRDLLPSAGARAASRPLLRTVEAITVYCNHWSIRGSLEPISGSLSNLDLDRWLIGLCFIDVWFFWRLWIAGAQIPSWKHMVSKSPLFQFTSCFVIIFALSKLFVKFVIKGSKKTFRGQDFHESDFYVEFVPLKSLMFCHQKRLFRWHEGEIVNLEHH